MTEHIAYFEMTLELLASVLSLPEGAKIVSIEMHGPRDCRIHVEHPDLPEVGEGNAYSHVTPVFRRVHQTAVEFEDWGL